MPKTTKTTIEDYLTPEAVKAVELYLIARTHYELMRREVRKITIPLLAERTLMATACTKASKTASVSEGFSNIEPRRITDPEDLFLCEDEPAVAEYFAESRRRQRAAGIKPADMPDNHDPDCCAHIVLVEAENHLINVTSEKMGLESSMLTGEKRKTYLDLVCKITINHPKTKSNFLDANTILDPFFNKK